MCGIVGILDQNRVSQNLYDALTILQHRGQDASGIATTDNKKLYLTKNNGLVRDVFQQSDMERLLGNVGIGHVRYPTAGSCSSDEAQPFYVNSPFGIALAHNGNLTNAEAIADELFRSDLRHINTGSDSEVLLNVLAHEIQARSTFGLKPKDFFDAISMVHDRCEGAYAVVALVIGQGLLAFRDPYGIRPLIYGEKDTPQGKSYMIASESVALSALGYKIVRDVLPGEAIFIDMKGQFHSKICSENTRLMPCLFELVYLSRPDSVLDGVSVYKARLRMGDKLADKIKLEWPDHNIDVVIPIPDTSRTSALQIAHGLGVKYREGFIKNRYIGRTFIMPEQTLRKKSVRQKLNPIELEFAGKNVLLVDDSIVRGTTCQQIINMAREAGAKRVYLASAAPPVRFPNVYGIDMPSFAELIAHKHSEEEICQIIGADRLIYQSLEDLCSAALEGNPRIQAFETSVFDGHYITGQIDEVFFQRLEKRRS
jgi:amidophosphoribosyltransferase